NGVTPGEDWATFVSRDVVDAIDTDYRTIASPAGRAIAGLSEGGYGAVNIALQYPNEFRVVESWSGYMRAAHDHSIFGRDLTGLSGAVTPGGRTSPRRGGWHMVSAARALAASIVSLAIVIAASGWLYVIQPRHAVAGPPVGDALPLDELSRRSAVPLLVFLAVW